jgi:HEAT repeat protein
MRATALVAALVGILLTAQAGTLRGERGQETEAQRIARLIKQLGDDAFAQREAASKELDALGEPALPALREAVSSPDAEIRRRAKTLVRSITNRVLAAAAKKELAKWEGAWAGSDGSWLKVKGDRWSVGFKNNTVA